jgi:hypothetical protein
VRERSRCQQLVGATQDCDAHVDGLLDLEPLASLLKPVLGQDAGPALELVELAGGAVKVAPDEAVLGAGEDAVDVAAVDRARLLEQQRRDDSARQVGEDAG